MQAARTAPVRCGDPRYLSITPKEHEPQQATPPLPWQEPLLLVWRPTSDVRPRLLLSSTTNKKTRPHDRVSCGPVRSEVFCRQRHHGAAAGLHLFEQGFRTRQQALEEEAAHHLLALAELVVTAGGHQHHARRSEQRRVG